MLEEKQKSMHNEELRTTIAKKCHYTYQLGS